MITTIYITNKSSECNFTIQEDVVSTYCTNYILKLNPNIVSEGPFEVNVVSGFDIVTLTGLTNNELKNGINLEINCP